MQEKLLECTRDVVCHFLDNVGHSIAAGAKFSEDMDLFGYIQKVYKAFERCVSEQPEVETNPRATAAEIKKSITPDYLVCLEDGKRFKSLKRHLRTDYGMTPDDYRTKWGLPADYPMVAPNYAKARSQLAHSMGLGLKRRKHASK